jgi:hypothetical protein
VASDGGTVLGGFGEAAITRHAHTVLRDSARHSVAPLLDHDFLYLASH